MPLGAIGGAALDLGLNQLNSAIDAGRARRMWRMQNEYNEPINQRKRLEDAGYSPHLPFMSGGASASGDAGSIDIPKTPNISSYQDYRLKDAQVSLAERQSEIAGIQAQRQDIQLQREQDIHNFMKGQVPAGSIEGYQGDGSLAPVDPSGRSYYQQSEYDQFNIRSYTAVSKAIDASLKSRFGGREKIASIDQINAAVSKAYADSGLADARTKMTNKEMAAYDGMVKVFNQFGADSDIGRAALEAIKFLMMRKK